MKYKHICFKCGNAFEIEHKIDTDKPTCNHCFKKLLEVKTAEEYYEFIRN